MPTADLVCWNCGTGLSEVPAPISRHEQCPVCFEALHCCRLCRHYRSDATGQCDEDRADPPVIKENANFCDWFKPGKGAFSGRRADRADAAKDRLEALFGGDRATDSEGKETVSDDASTSETAAKHTSAEEEARARLDELFGKE